MFHASIGSLKELKAGEYYSEIKKLVDINDTNWAGFIFPEDFKLYDLKFNTAVDLRWSVFEDVTINNIQSLEKFDMSHSTFNGNFHISKAEFKKEVDLHDSIFQKDVEIYAKILGRAGFHGCDFYGRTSFLGSITGGGTFHMSRFHEAVTFRGGRDINLKISSVISTSIVGDVGATSNNDINPRFISRIIKLAANIKNHIKARLKKLHHQLTNAALSLYEKTIYWVNKQKRELMPLKDSSVNIRWLFDSEIVMTEVEFRHPENTKFMGVDMSRVSLVGTDVKGVHFYDAKFYQPNLKRQGLYDEVLLLETQDYNYSYYMLPRIESEYRNVRVALENNKNYSAATDFYVGEMEARRRQMFYPKRYFFSIEALYHALSNYGASPWLALRMFIWLVILHTVLTVTFVITPETAFVKILKIKENIPLINDIFKLSIINIVNSFNILTFQRGNTILEITQLSGHIVNTLFRVLGPVQLALIALAIRVKIKRH